MATVNTQIDLEKLVDEFIAHRKIPLEFRRLILITVRDTTFESERKLLAFLDWFCSELGVAITRHQANALQKIAESIVQEVREE